MTKFLVRLLYLPFFLIVGNGLAIYLVEQGYPKLWLFGLLIAFIALAFMLEKLVSTTYVEFSAAHPLDDHNQLLLKHTHPEDWINPEPGGRYNLAVIGAGAEH